MSRIIVAITFSIIVVVGIGAFFIDRALNDPSRDPFRAQQVTDSDAPEVDGGVFIKDESAIYDYR